MPCCPASVASVPMTSSAFVSRYFQDGNAVCTYNILYNRYGKADSFRSFLTLCLILFVGLMAEGRSGGIEFRCLVGFSFLSTSSSLFRIHRKPNKLFNEDLGGLKLVMWAHSFMSRMQWNLYARSANVKRIVCVGNEELELYCDHKAFKKSTVIFNAFPLPSSTPFTISLLPRKEEKGVLCLPRM